MIKTISVHPANNKDIKKKNPGCHCVALAGWDSEMSQPLQAGIKATHHNTQHK